MNYEKALRLPTEVELRYIKSESILFTHLIQLMCPLYRVTLGILRLAFVFF